MKRACRGTATPQVTSTWLTIAEEKSMVTRDQALVTSSPVLAVVVGQLLLGGFLAPGAQVLRPADSVRRVLRLSR